jgi:hypothetical protein
MLANLLPSDPDQRRLARRFAVVLGTLFLALLAAVIATAEASAPNSKLPLVNSSSERLSSKKMIWL